MQGRGSEMGSIKNDGGCAFPAIKANGQIIMGGMSLRDWFAGQALPAIIEKYSDRHDSAWLANAAYKSADAMLEARK